MNKQRRKILNAVLSELDRLKEPIDKEAAVLIIQQAQEKVSDCADDEQDALDNRPESMMWSTMNEDMGENVSDLYNASTELEIMMESCDKMKDYSYDLIRNNAINAVSKIKEAIHR